MASKQQSDKQADKASEAKQKETHEQQGDSKAIAADAQADSDLLEQLNSLSEVLNSDLSDIDPEEGIRQIDEWYNVLHKSKDSAAKELSNNLKQLKQMLKGNKATGHEIGEALAELGEQTSEFAGNADKELKTPLQKLGKQFSKAGSALGKAEDQELTQEVESLTETIEGQELTELDSNEAVAAIDHWHGFLAKSEDESFKAIANGLKELKQKLKLKNPKQEDIAEILNQLGEQTVEAAAEAPRGLKGAIQKLGKGLSKSAKSLDKAEK